MPLDGTVGHILLGLGLGFKDEGPGLPQSRGTLLGVAILRITILDSLNWGSLDYGQYHLGIHRV